MISDLPKVAIFYKRKKLGIIHKKEFVHAKTCANAHNKTPSPFLGKRGFCYILQLKSFGYFFQEAAAGLRFDRYTFFTEQGSKVFGHKACGNGI